MGSFTFHFLDHSDILYATLTCQGLIGGSTGCRLRLRPGRGEHVRHAAGRAKSPLGTMEVLLRGRGAQFEIVELQLVQLECAETTGIELFKTGSETWQPQSIRLLEGSWMLGSGVWCGSCLRCVAPDLYLQHLELIWFNVVEYLPHFKPKTFHVDCRSYLQHLTFQDLERF